MKRVILVLFLLVSGIVNSQTLSVGNNQTYNTNGNANYSLITLGNNSQLNVINNHIINNSGNITSNNGIGITIATNATLNVVGCLTGVNNLDLIVEGTLVIGCVTINNNGFLSVGGGGSIDINGDLIAGSGTQLDIEFGGALNINGDVVIDENTSVVNVDGELNIDGSYNGPNFTGDGTIIENGVVIYPVSLPVSLKEFYGKKINGYNHLYWITSSEQNTSHFDLQKSIDGEIWNTITTLNAAGNSITKISYNVTDYDVVPIINYYRLQQYDLDGVYETFGPISIDNTGSESIKTIVKYINLNGQEINPEKLSIMNIYIEVYNDGNIRKVMK